MMLHTISVDRHDYYMILDVIFDQALLYIDCSLYLLCCQFIALYICSYVKFNYVVIRMAYFKNIIPYEHLLMQLISNNLKLVILYIRWYWCTEMPTMPFKTETGTTTMVTPCV